MPEELTPGPRLDATLEKYWDQRKSWLYSVPTAVVVPAFTPKVRPLPAAEVQGLFSRLLSHHDREAAAVEARAALAQDPAELNALRTSFYHLPSTPAQRLRYAQAAIQAHSENAESWLMAADTAATSSDAAAALERALAIDPLNPRVHLQLGIQKVKKGEREAALVHTRFALRRLTPSSELLSAHVLALAASHRCVQARQLAENRVPRYSDETRASLRRAWASVQASCVEARR
jgi:hypothetical protein